MFDHFMAVLILPVIFVCGWVMLYCLFYKGQFLDNNYDLLGGLALTAISLGMIALPSYFAYMAIKVGILLTALKDFIIVALIILVAVVFIAAVLKMIDLAVKRYMCKQPTSC